MQGATDERGMVLVEQAGLHARCKRGLLPAQKPVRVAAQAAQHAQVEAPPDLIVHKRLRERITEKKEQEDEEEQE